MILKNGIVSVVADATETGGKAGNEIVVSVAEVASP
jgi:hypothetical protein